jgi:hypothetical protein
VHAAMTMTGYGTRELTVAQLRRRLERVVALIARAGARDRRHRIRLVLVHEAVRRQLSRAEDAETAQIPHFDPRRWDQDEHARFVAYEALVERVRERTMAVLPAGARVAMVSRGDDRLLELDDRVAAHFPQQADGRYAGFYPEDARGAIEQLRALRSVGTRYVVFPATAFWWLDYYAALERWLAPSTVWAGEDCTVFDLANAGKEDPA